MRWRFLLLVVVLAGLIAGSALGAPLGVGTVRKAFYLNNDARDLTTSADWSYVFNSSSTNYINYIDRIDLRFSSAWTVDAVEVGVNKELTLFRVARVRACLYDPGGFLLRDSDWEDLLGQAGSVSATLTFSPLPFADIAEVRVLGCSCVFKFVPPFFFFTTCDQCPACP